MNVPLGKSITLVCPASGTPKPTVEWYKNHQFIESTMFNEQFFLQNIQKNDEGIYRCVATNVAGSTSRIFNISIQSKSIVLLVVFSTFFFRLVSPYFDHQSTQNLSRFQQKSVVVNHTVTLVCPAIGAPKPKLNWFFNGEEIHPDKKHVVMKMNGKKLLISRIRVRQ